MHIMSDSNAIYFGQSLLTPQRSGVSGEIIELDGEEFYRISAFDEMPPFFISVVSHSDHWMFISSKGGLTCGRRNPENALFPYYTDDKIHDASVNTGSKSLFLVDIKEKRYLWEPFRMDLPGAYKTTRNIYKNTAGNKLVFEELNHSLRLKFQYAWMNSEKYGFVKQSGLTNLESESGVRICVIDGVQNILPCGVNQMMQSNMSTLVDGYKKCELHEETGLGIFTLSSIITDSVEPSEALNATTVWSSGLGNPGYLLSTDQLQGFMEGRAPETEISLEGRRGAYFVHGDFYLDTEEKKEWLMVADVCQGPSDVPATVNLLRERAGLIDRVLEDVSEGTASLKERVSMADGNQLSADGLTTARHFSNTLFNIMRGGIFPQDYQIDISDLNDSIKSWNSQVHEKYTHFIENLDEPLQYQDLFEKARRIADPDLIRLIYEYLPLTFSRRHGDPSRPWNQFSIDVKKDDGSQKLYYQGNWRDIFQNWEALAISYPGFIESFITKFLNASTADGYNPYRITKDGIDWEILDPDDPWSNIGYWGDHQIIYLLRFLELSMKYHPGKLQELLTDDLYVYANVPYRIKPYEKLVADPRNSIEYHADLEELIAERIEGIGSDGKLLLNSGGEVLRVSLAEKILVTLLSKLSNFIPEGGIWMNTQRPEWNDANNALVGNGLSMVTLYYLRRFIGIVNELFSSAPGPFSISEEVEIMLQAILNVFQDKKGLLNGRISNVDRRKIVDLLGLAGSKFRYSIYHHGFSERKSKVSVSVLKDLFALSMDFLNHTIDSNRREDNLFHSYNLVDFSKNACSIDHLTEMLEGQVAVISSGYLNAEEITEMLDALRESRMYRQDQNSYTLYPNKHLPAFLDKNVVPKATLDQSDFLLNELKRGSRDIIETDENGNVHFNGTIRNARELGEKLNSIDDISEADKKRICSIYVDCFNHKQFTGRSGTFYKYEGLGSIYWHMVSKLLLAVQETCIMANAEQLNPEIILRLIEHYNQIKEGLGLHKPPDVYGAFPTDPYSHTPAFSGVQQPGMTGQVKEDVIARFGELGVIISGGCVLFNPRLLTDEEFLESEKDWNINGQVLKLSKGELGFSMCSTPVIYSQGNSPSITVVLSGGERTFLPGTNYLDQNHSSMVFNRTGGIKYIRVEIKFR